MRMESDGFVAESGFLHAWLKIAENRGTVSGLWLRYLSWDEL